MTGSMRGIAADTNTTIGRNTKRTTKTGIDGKTRTTNAKIGMSMAKRKTSMMTKERKKRRRYILVVIVILLK